MAFNDTRYSLLAILKTIVFVFLCLYSLPAVPYKDIAFLLDSSLISRHLPFPASREFAGVGLGKGVEIYYLFRYSQPHYQPSNQPPYQPPY